MFDKILDKLNINDPHLRWTLKQPVIVASYVLFAYWILCDFIPDHNFRTIFIFAGLIPYLAYFTYTINHFK